MSTIISKTQVVLRDGKPKAVVLDIKEYERLLETAEEKEDLAELRRMKKRKTVFRELKAFLQESV